MAFLNFILVFGIAAAALPVLIHLFSRSRRRVVRWAAMHLLEPAIRKTRRTVKIEQLILLLIRAAILAALALCMARPVLTGWKALTGDTPSSVVILLDDSYSMDAGGAGQNGFEQARRAAAKIIADLKPGSEVSLVTLGGTARPVGDEIRFDSARLVEALDKRTPGYGSADTPGGLQIAAGVLENMRHARRDLVLLSDFQRINWTPSQADARERALKMIEAMPVKPNVIFFRTPAASVENIAVESMDVSPKAVGVGQTVAVRATLHNFGDAPAPDTRVYFRVDGQERSTSRVSLGAGQAGQVRFTNVMPTPGSHVVEVLTDADRLKADNSLMAVVPVMDRLPVLLVDGEPSREALRSETDFLDLALQPLGDKKNAPAALFEPRVIEAAAFDAKTLADARVVVLANVKQLDDAQVRALDAFVRGGGGLLIFPGGRVNAPWYNATMYAEGLGLLPGKLISTTPPTPGHAKAAKIVSQHFTHPALELFNDPRNGNLGEAEIRQWWKVQGFRVQGSGEEKKGPGAEVPSSSALNPEPRTLNPSPEPRTLSALDTGDPFLMEKPVGRGVVLLAATAADADWSDLPLRPFYLPLMQQLVLYAAERSTPPRNLDVGQPLVALLPVGDAGKDALLTLPDGTTRVLPITEQGSRGVAEFLDTKLPGHYTLNLPGNSINEHFVVNTSRAESDLHALTDAELEKIDASLGATVVHDSSQYAQLDQTLRHGREIWRPLLALVLVLVFIELLFQQWLSRRTRA